MYVEYKNALRCVDKNYKVYIVVKKSGRTIKVIRSYTLDQELLLYKEIKENAGRASLYFYKQQVYIESASIY